MDGFFKQPPGTFAKLIHTNTQYRLSVNCIPGRRTVAKIKDLINLYYPDYPQPCKDFILKRTQMYFGKQKIELGDFEEDLMKNVHKLGYDTGVFK
jgi:hypothetical protein